MSTPGRRRNRSLASCEPCRKGKVRCDHQKPICGGCQRRGLQSRCWYHPAPLTRRAVPVPPPVSNPVQQIQNPFETHAFRYVPHTSDLGARSRAEIESVRPATFSAWQFTHSAASEPKPYLSLVGAESELSQEQNMSTMMHLVSRLSFLPTIEKLVREYYTFSQAALVANPIVLQLIASMKAGLMSAGYAYERQTENLELQNTVQLAGELLRASSLDVVITPSLDLEGFCALFTGPNLRVEALGLLYTIAARSALYFSRHDDKRENSLVDDMAWYGNSCLRLARELSPQTTDMMVWLAHENLQLTTLFEGDASLNGWRRVGELSTDLFALGLHREITYNPLAIPFFLAECRRKTYASSYGLDKIFAMVLNRPPRISTRHADCRLPLDLSIKDIFVSSDEDIENSQRKVGLDGWGTELKHRSTTWTRVRAILAAFREEMIEYQISSVRPADEDKLQELSNRCDQAWEALPPHVKYSPDCWTSGLSSAVCFMLGKVYLSYLHIKFYIHRLLGEDCRAYLPVLLELSFSILETVIQITNSRNKTSFTLRDVPEIVLSYGLPCATILITALENTAKDPAQPLPPSLKSSALIRSLSVLVSHLENLSGPAEPNHAFCLQAAKSLSRKLDRILDLLADPISRGTSIENEEKAQGAGHGTLISHITPQTISSLSPFGEVGSAETSDFDNIDLTDLDNFDLATWVIDVDLDTACVE